MSSWQGGRKLFLVTVSRCHFCEKLVCPHINFYLQYCMHAGVGSTSCCGGYDERRRRATKCCCVSSRIYRAPWPSLPVNSDAMNKAAHFITLLFHQEQGVSVWHPVLLSHTRVQCCKKAAYLNTLSCLKSRGCLGGTLSCSPRQHYCNKAAYFISLSCLAHAPFAAWLSLPR